LQHLVSNTSIRFEKFVNIFPLRLYQGYHLFCLFPFSVTIWTLSREGRHDNHNAEKENKSNSEW
jgi:hypothetical protein